MAITTNAQRLAAPLQRIVFVKTAARSGVAGMPSSLFDIAGTHVGVLAIGNTANGLVPTNATAGYPAITPFGGGATGYLDRFEAYGPTQQGFWQLYDRVFAAGAYAFNAAITLASQPSYSGRVPGGTDFTGLEIWLEQVTAGTGIQNVAVTYTNAAGVAGRTTGTFATAANVVGRCWRLPLQVGDSGVQQINSVTGTVATVGTFNIMVLRRLIGFRTVGLSTAPAPHEFLRTGSVQIFDTSALYALYVGDGNSSGTSQRLHFDVING